MTNSMITKARPQMLSAAVSPVDSRAPSLEPAPLGRATRSPRIADTLRRVLERIVGHVLGAANSLPRRLHEMDFGSVRFDHRHPRLPVARGRAATTF